MTGALVLIGDISSYCRSGDESSKKSKWRKGRSGSHRYSNQYVLYLTKEGRASNGTVGMSRAFICSPVYEWNYGCMDILVRSPRIRIRTQIYSLGPHFLETPPKLPNGGFSCTASLTSSVRRGGCVRWPIIGDSLCPPPRGKTSSANFRFWPDQAKTPSRVRVMRQSQLIPRTAGHSKRR